MKKIIVAVISILMLASCGVGSYSVSSGKADECMISFTSAKKTAITVFIDDQVFDMSTVQTKAFKKDRRIKETSLNTIILKPGAHDVKVIEGENEVYSKKLFISTGEHKIVEL